MYATTAQDLQQVADSMEVNPLDNHNIFDQFVLFFSLPKG